MGGDNKEYTVKELYSSLMRRARSRTPSGMPGRSLEGSETRSFAKALLSLGSAAGLSNGASTASAAAPPAARWAAYAVHVRVVCPTCLQKKHICAVVRLGLCVSVWRVMQGDVPLARHVARVAARVARLADLGQRALVGHVAHLSAVVAAHAAHAVVVCGVSAALVASGLGAFGGSCGVLGRGKGERVAGCVELPGDTGHGPRAWTPQARVRNEAQWHRIASGALPVDVYLKWACD